jgi:hypothetical protein
VLQTLATGFFHCVKKLTPILASVLRRSVAGVEVLLDHPQDLDIHRLGALRQGTSTTTMWVVVSVTKEGDM